MPKDTDGILFPASGLGDELGILDTGTITEIQDWAALHPLAVATLYVGMGWAKPIFPGSHRGAPSARVFIQGPTKDPLKLWRENVSVSWDAWDAVAVVLEQGSSIFSTPLMKKALQTSDTGYLLSQSAKLLEAAILSGGFDGTAGGSDPAGHSSIAGWSASWDGGFHRE